MTRYTVTLTVLPADTDPTKFAAYTATLTLTVHANDTGNAIQSAISIAALVYHCVVLAPAKIGVAP